MSSVSSGGAFSLSAGRVHHVPPTAARVEEVRRGIERIKRNITSLKLELRQKQRSLRWMERQEPRRGA